MPAEVKAIVIQFADGETKTLPTEEARALYRQLHELFGRTSQATLQGARDRLPAMPPLLCSPIVTPPTEPAPQSTPQVWCVMDSEQKA